MDRLPKLVPNRRLPGARNSSAWGRRNLLFIIENIRGILVHPTDRSADMRRPVANTHRLRHGRVRLDGG